jgi:hypothetical protein
MDDVGEQATGARTTLIITNCTENFHFPSGDVFPLIARGLLPNFSFLRGNFHGNFSSAESPRNTYTFLLQEKSSRVPFFITFRAKSFRPHGRSRLFFFSARAGHLAWRGGRARRSFCLLSEPSGRAAHINILIQSLFKITMIILYSYD